MRFRQAGACTVLAVCLAACGRPDGGVRVEGPAVTAVQWTGPTYVTDLYGRAWQRPTDVSLGRSLDLGGLRWKGWGTARPTATGTATDVNCVAGCPGGKPSSYRVEVVLGGLVRRGDVAYYGHASLKPLDPPEPFWAVGYDDMDLDVPDR
ncbi:hypothetical protein ACVNF4_33015 [Streptomyces sp. S6]